MARIFFIIITITLSIYAVSFNYTTFQAKFTQNITNEQGKILRYSGELFIQKSPIQGLWTYQKPVPKSVYIFDKETIIYEPKLAQATYITQQDTLNINHILSSLQPLQNNRYKTTYNKTDIYVDFENNKPSKITYKDSFDNTITLLFYEVKINEIINPQIFRFSPPANTDFIRR